MPGDIVVILPAFFLKRPHIIESHIEYYLYKAKAMLLLHPH